MSLPLFAFTIYISLGFLSRYTYPTMVTNMSDFPVDQRDLILRKQDILMESILTVANQIEELKVLMSPDGWTPNRPLRLSSTESRGPYHHSQSDRNDERYLSWSPEKAQIKKYTQLYNVESEQGTEYFILGYGRGPTCY